MMLFMILTFLVQTVYARDMEQILFENLFEMYDKRVRPKDLSDGRVYVRITLELNQLIEINEKAESMKVSTWIGIGWKDERLSWNVTEYAGVTKINVRPGEMWVPDIVLFNSVDNSKMEMNKMETDIVVNQKGDAWWTSAMVITTRCSINVK